MLVLVCAVRESIADELRMLRQDKYAWILHAEREWENHIQQLVHERGLWPMVSATTDGKPIWQLCTKEGPFRMRKKLERPKLNQTDIYDTSLEVSFTFFTSIFGGRFSLCYSKGSR